MRYSKSIMAALERVRRGEIAHVQGLMRATLCASGLVLDGRITERGVDALLRWPLTTPQIVGLRDAKRGVLIANKATRGSLPSRGAIDADGRITPWGLQLLAEVDRGRT